MRSPIGQGVREIRRRMPNHGLRSRWQWRHWGRRTVDRSRYEGPLDVLGAVVAWWTKVPEGVRSAEFRREPGPFGADFTCQGRRRPSRTDEGERSGRESRRSRGGLRLGPVGRLPVPAAQDAALPERWSARRRHGPGKVPETCWREGARDLLAGRLALRDRRPASERQRSRRSSHGLAATSIDEP